MAGRLSAPRVLSLEDGTFGAPFRRLGGFRVGLGFGVWG